MAIYRSVHEEYEKAIRMGHRSGPREKPEAKSEDMTDTLKLTKPTNESSPIIKRRTKK